MVVSTEKEKYILCLCCSVVLLLFACFLKTKETRNVVCLMQFDVKGTIIDRLFESANDQKIL